jgi:hypothetical protein
MVMRPPGFQHLKPTPETRFDVVHMLSHVSDVNLIGAWFRSSAEWKCLRNAIGSHLAIAVDIDITFLVENPAIEVKFHLAKKRRVRFPAIGLAARTGHEKRNLIV